MIERVLIVGSGSIGRRHLRIVRDSLPNAKIWVLRHLKSSETLDWSDGNFQNLEEACAFCPQIAVIANPSPFHVGTSLALAEIGSHLLIEKPISDSPEGLRCLLKLSKERNIVLQVGYNLRFLPSLEQFRKRILSGIAGKIISIRCEVGQYLPSWRPGFDYRQSVSGRQALGGGVLLELSHELDYLHWMFGRVKWVSAWLGKLSELEIDVEDTAHLLLGFDKNICGSCPVAAVSLDCTRQDTTRLCTVIGEHGSLRWDGITGEIQQWMAGSRSFKTVFHHAHQRDDSYCAQWQDFLSCIRTGNTPRVTGEDGVAVMNIVDAARQSALDRNVRTLIVCQGTK